MIDYNDSNERVQREDEAVPVPVPEREAQGRLERLYDRVQELMQESTDYAFTEFLRQMRGRVINQKYQIDLLTDELDRRCRAYQEGQAARNAQGIQNGPQQSAAEPLMPLVPPESPVPLESQMPPESQVPPAHTIPRQETVRQKNNLEFTIGAAVLSVVGSVFILIALVLLGIYYLNGFAKGMSLYAVCLAVMAVSELLLYKRWQKLGMTFSAVGMGGLYLTTLVNYLWLHNFPMWAAMALTGLITVGVILISRKKDAVVYRILGMAAVYVCILMLAAGEQDTGNMVSQAEFLAVITILFLINIMCLLVPVRRAYTAVNVTHIALNTAFTGIVCIWLRDTGHWSSFSEMWHYPVFVAGSVIVMQCIFVCQIRRQAERKPEGKLQDNTAVCTAYGICAFFYSLMAASATDFPLLIESMSRDVYMVHQLICAAAAAVICVIPMVILREREEKWFSWYLFNFLIIAIYQNAVSDWEAAWCLAVLLAASKLLSFMKKPLLRISDAVLTAYVCIIALVGYNQGYTLPLFAGLLLSVLCLNDWKTYFEVILTFTIAFYTSEHMLSMLKLPVFTGILFAGMLLFNNVGRWRDKGIAVYNYLVLAGQTVCCLLLLNPVYRNAYLTYLCMLVFGVSTIVICFQENYHMNFRMKQMILAVYLTYMALAVRTNYPVLNSIFLMLIALISVGMGFAGRQKSVRIYGLVLSLAVCGKIVLYDFYEAPVLQKTIVFFIAGVLALAISAIYMVLEKKYGRALADMQDPAA